MQTFLRIDLNLFMALVCAIIYFSSKKAPESRILHNRLFRLITLVVGILLLIEAITRVLNETNTKAFFLANYFFTAFQYILTPIPAIIWELYVKSQLFHDTKSMQKDLIVFGSLFAICFVLIITTPLTNSMFYFDDGYAYHRGILYPVLAITSLLPIIASAACLLFSGKRVSPKYMAALICISAVIIGIALIQIYFEGVTLIWSGIALVLLLAFTNLQKDQVYLDHLTGIFNRRQMDTYLAERIRMSKDGRMFSCILLDIDHFKMVNDKLGHVAGDEALKDATDILKSCIRKGDFLARYGGDEFIIITDIDSDAALQSLIFRIGENSTSFNKTMQRAYHIGFSAGYAIYRPESGWSQEQFISHVDMLMYQNKCAPDKQGSSSTVC